MSVDGRIRDRVDRSDQVCPVGLLSREPGSSEGECHEREKKRVNGRMVGLRNGRPSMAARYNAGKCDGVARSALDVARGQRPGAGTWRRLNGRAVFELAQFQQWRERHS
jgi:hypothetical protein